MLRKTQLFFVVDEMAKILFKKMLGKCTKEEKYSTITVSVIPVGGYENTAKLAIETKRMLFSGAKVFAVWDEDVFSVTIPGDTTHRIEKLYNDNRELIYSLGFTPELCIVESIESLSTSLVSAIRKEFKCEIRTVLSDKDYLECHGNNPRKVAKKKLDVIIDFLKSYSGYSYDIVIDKLADIVLENTYGESDIKEIIMPILSKIM